VGSVMVRQLRWRAVNGGRTTGFLACKQDAWSRFLTVCVEIRTPDAARNSLFNVTADDIRFRFAIYHFWTFKHLKMPMRRHLTAEKASRAIGFLQTVLWQRQAQGNGIIVWTIV
jgi:hypothetical protein